MPTAEKEKKCPRNEREASKSKSRREARKACNVPEDARSGCSRRVVGHFEDDAVKQRTQRIVESWSEGCVGESKCDGITRLQGIDRAVLSVASLRFKRLVCPCAKRDSADFAASRDRSDVRLEEDAVPRFFPIKDDLNSTEILLCEALLKREEEDDRRRRCNLQPDETEGKNDRWKIIRSLLNTADRINFESKHQESKLIDQSRGSRHDSCLLRETRNLGSSDRTNDENDAKSARERVRDSGGRKWRGANDLMDRKRFARTKSNTGRARGSVFCPTNVDMLARSEYRSRIVRGSSDSSVETRDNGRKSGGGEEEDTELRERRFESIATSRTKPMERTSLTSRRSNDENNAVFPYGIANEKEKDSTQKRRTRRGITKAETGFSPVGKGLPFESNSCSKDFRLDARSLEKPSAFRHRIGSGFLADRKCEKHDSMPRKNSSTTCCCPGSSLSRYRYRCCRGFCEPESRRIDRSSVRVAKGRGKISLSKVLVYPPCGEDGPPLTLYKNVSSIKCAVRGNADVGFRYDVTYVQKFSTCYPELSQ